MMPATALRRIAPSYSEWRPHGYQLRAVDHLCARGSAALFLDPGMGKTAVTLAAFCELKDAGMANHMLVIAPMRVCQLVWRQEAAKWEQFRHLRFAVMAGKSAEKRKALLNADADVWLINPESVGWLCEQFMFQRLPFDTLVIDELTKFKNARAERSKKLQPLADKITRRWGLTGTPVPNGYMDLFGQMKILDGGASLGKFISAFRDRFFDQGRDGYSWDLKRDASARIEKAIEPYVFRAAAEDYLTLPPLIERRVELELSKPIAAKYKEMKRDMIVQLEGKTITAANSAAVYNKLQQFAGGAMYTVAPDFVPIHDLKLDALDDLIEELQGQPLLVAYAYGHELARILERHPNTPYLGGGVSGKRAEQIEADWNAGKIPLLLCHPASAGHGLNMQLGGASHLCWFTQTWDYELYDQFIRRIHRQGNSAERIVMHKLIVLNTIDDLVESALQGKETTQDALLAALKSELIEDDAVVAFTTTVGANMRKLSSPGAASTTTAPAPAPAPAQPAASGVRGWGHPAPRAAATAAEAPAPAPAPATPAKPAGWGNTAFANHAKPAEPPAADPAPPANGLAHFSTDVQAQFAPEGHVDNAWNNAAGADAPAIDVTETHGGPGQPRMVTHTADGQRLDKAYEAPPFDGGQPVLQTAPAKPAKGKRAKAAETRAEELTNDVAAYTPPDYHIDVAAMMKAMLESGVSLDDAMEALGNITDHMRGKG